MDEGPRATRFRRRLTMIGMIGYAGIVAIITLSPRMPGSGTVNRIVNRILDSLHARGLFLQVDYLTVEFLGNILMFVPLGIFAAFLVSRKNWWTLLFAGTLYSGFIELIQLLFLPGRYPEIRDLISNTTGFLIGAAIALSIRALVAHRDHLVHQDRSDNQQAL